MTACKLSIISVEDIIYGIGSRYEETVNHKRFCGTVGAGLITKILSCFIFLFACIIGDEGNGIYAAAYQVYVFIYVIANSGIPVAIAKSVSELTAVGNYKDALRIFKISRFFLIIIGTVLTVLMFVTAKPLAVMINSENHSLQ